MWGKTRVTYVTPKSLPPDPTGWNSVRIPPDLDTRRGDKTRAIARLERAPGTQNTNAKRPRAGADILPFTLIPDQSECFPFVDHGTDNAPSTFLNSGNKLERVHPSDVRRLIKTGILFILFSSITTPVMRSYVRTTLRLSMRHESLSLS